MPPPVRQVVRAFDDGMYPQLLASPISLPLIDLSTRIRSASKGGSRLESQGTPACSGEGVGVTEGT